MIFVISFLLFSHLSLSQEISTNSEQDEVENRIYALFNEFKKLSTMPYSLEKTQKNREILDNYFAKKLIAGLVMGRNWRNLNKEQKVEFINVFSDYMVFAVLPNTDVFFKNGEIYLDSKVTKKDTSHSFYDRYHLRVIYKEKYKENIELSLSLLKQKSKPQDSYKIFQVSIGGSIGNIFLAFKSSFDSVFKRKGYQGLINDLRLKIRKNKEIQLNNQKF